MPREERLKCVACDANIDCGRKHWVGDGLWKLFLSARSLKKIKSDDFRCIGCRMKYLNWLKKIEGDFDQFNGRREAGVSVNTIMNDFEVDADENNIESSVESAGENEMESGVPTISIPIERCIKPHRTCIICGLRDGPSKILSKNQCMLVFLKRGILIPSGARCCPEHLYKQQLSFDSLGHIRANQMDQLVCDANHLQEILNDCRLILEKQKTFDFDDPYSLDNKDYYNITDLQKDQFESVIASIESSMRNSNIRSIRVAVAIFCAKMRLGLSNHVLATMFHIYDKRAVSRIIHQVIDALIKDFVPAHLGFRHISRQTVLKLHQITIANVLLTDDDVLLRTISSVNNPH